GGDRGERDHARRERALSVLEVIAEQHQIAVVGARLAIELDRVARDQPLPTRGQLRRAPAGAGELAPAAKALVQQVSHLQRADTLVRRAVALHGIGHTARFPVHERAGPGAATDRILRAVPVEAKLAGAGTTEGRRRARLRQRREQGQRARRRAAPAHASPPHTRAPKISVPMRTQLLPQATATSRSRLMPMLSSGRRAVPPCRSRSSCSRSNCWRALAASPAPAGTVIKPRKLRLGSACTAAISSASCAGSQPALCACAPRFTSMNTASSPPG